MARIKIAPSILSADFACLGAEVRAIDAAGADWIHIDVMDNHFVPNLTIGPMVVQALRPHSALPFDVHLMVQPADQLVEAFAEAGADLLSVHPESGPHLHRTLSRIQALGRKCGVVLNPATPLDCLDHVLEMLDLVLLMSVNPGFGGQQFIEATLPKLDALAQRVAKAGLATEIEIDGGVDADNAGRLADAGATVLVAGTASFRGGPGAYADNIARLKGSKTALRPERPK